MNKVQKSCAIFGAGLSGRAAQELASELGYRVVLYDEKGAGDSSKFEEKNLAAFDEFVFSPGFAREHPWRNLVESAGRVCLSELAFAAKHWNGPLFGITGTNGKTTLAQLVYAGLQNLGFKCVVAGNIGIPFSQVVRQTKNSEGVYAVLEVSSFQAELVHGLQLDALLWSNFAEDHLDRYQSMDAYFKAKANLLDVLRPDGVCILGQQVSEWMIRHGKSLAKCTIANSELGAVYDLREQSPFLHFPFSENYLSVGHLWNALGFWPRALVDAANEFQLAPHRLQVISEEAGIRYWDDSKATNFHAALAAVKSVDRPIVWIGGGSLKGGDLERFASEIARNVDSVYLYGEAGLRLQSLFEERLNRVFYAEEFKDVVEAAVVNAKNYVGANVLLSPGFASFGQFQSYAARGKSFAEIVLSLKKE